ncbi:hypothetical protein FALBO_2860, partial [Fusarium albosuccineum]
MTDNNLVKTCTRPVREREGS